MYFLRSFQDWNTLKIRIKARWLADLLLGPNWARLKSNVILRHRRPFLILISNWLLNRDQNRQYLPKGLSISAAEFTIKTTCPNRRWNVSVNSSWNTLMLLYWWLSLCVIETGMVKDDYSSTETSPSNEYSFQKHRHRPRYFHGSTFKWTINHWFPWIDGSHPLPKKLPALRLVDQSNLWSGDQREGPWRPFAASEATIVRPKAKNGGKNIDSPLDHSIAVWNHWC